MSENADFEARIVDAIYRGACVPSELVRAVDLITTYFDSPGAGLAQVDPVRPDGHIGIASGILDARNLALYANYAHLDPMPRALARLAVGSVNTSRQLVPESERPAAFMNEYLLPMGVVENLGCSLLRADGRFAAFSVLEGRGQEPFGNRDVVRLERLTPHLTRALQIRRLFLQSEERGRALESVIDRNETGMVGLRRDGSVLFVNSAARAIAAARDGIALDRNARLVAADRAGAKQLTLLHADVAAGGAGGLVRITHPSGRRPYVVLVSPLPSGDDVFATLNRSVLFAIHDPERRPMSTAGRIAQLLRVTPATARVVQAILEGVELKDYAEGAEISMHTVRFHLKTAFAHTGARTQADLVRRALLALSDLGPYFSDRT